MSRRILEASMGIAGLALVLGALPARLAAQSEKDLDKISKHLRAGAVDEAQKACALLPQRWFDLTERLPYGTQRTPQPGLHADLFARCAVSSLRAGDTEQASWRWHAAHAFDPKTALASATELEAQTQLPAVRRIGQGLPALMVAEKKDWHEADLWMAEAPSQLTAPSSPLRQLGPPRDRAKLSLRGGFKCQIELEAILGRNGRLREPAVARIESCVPTQVLVVLDALGERRYERARAESGEPIDVAYRLQLGDFTKSTSRGPSKE